VLETATKPRSGSVGVRRDLRPGDLGAITRIHGAVYTIEYGVGPRFEADVARGLAEAVEAGWPRRGGLWIVEHRGRHAGNLALTEEADGAGRVRWFLVDPSLRGRGLGRDLLTELVAEADAAGYDPLRLETFSELRAAAHLYRAFGFALVSAGEDDRWGRPLLLQRYERRRP
jgi:ribosomal protein S18 acetylase RimI-like enzyme